MTTCPYCNNTEYVLKKGFNQRPESFHSIYCHFMHRRKYAVSGSEGLRLRSLNPIKLFTQLQNEIALIKDRMVPVINDTSVAIAINNLMNVLKGFNLVERFS